MGDPSSRKYDIAIVVRMPEGAQQRETPLPDLGARLVTQGTLTIGSSDGAEMRLPSAQGISNEYGTLFVGAGKLTYADSYTSNGTRVQIGGHPIVTVNGGAPIELADLDASRKPAPVSLTFSHVGGIEVCLTFEPIVKSP